MLKDGRRHGPAKGDLVKIDFGVHIEGHIGDNALTIEIGNDNEHTEQIEAARKGRSVRDIASRYRGTKLAKQLLNLPSMQTQPIRNLCDISWAIELQVFQVAMPAEKTTWAFEGS